jgi:hypothetical protein
MLTYLYTLDYDYREEVASAMHYMQNQMENYAPSISSDQIPAVEQRKKRRTVLMNNVVVYALADKYRTPELKLLAQQNLEALLLSESTISGLANIVDSVFKTTLKSDTLLRNAAAYWCASNSRLVVKDNNFVSVLRDHEYLGLTVLQDTLLRHDEELRRASEARTRVLDERKQMRSQLGALKNAIEVIFQNI